MRWRHTATRRGVMVLAVAALGFLPTATSTALGAPDCTDSTTAELAPSLTELQQALGAVMGSPLSCPIVDARGNVIQSTTTGLAIAEPDGTGIFASGDHHWALTAGSLQTWTGNWHDGLYPPSVVTPEQSQQPPAVASSLASVQAMTVVHVPDDASNAVVVQDPDGSMFTVETDSGCGDVIAAPGDHVFIRSSGLRTDLILLQQNETCAVAEMNPAAGD